MWCNNLDQEGNSFLEVTTSCVMLALKRACYQGTQSSVSTTSPATSTKMKRRYSATRTTECALLDHQLGMIYATDSLPFGDPLLGDKLQVPAKSPRYKSRITLNLLQLADEGESLDGDLELGVWPT